MATTPTRYQPELTFSRFPEVFEKLFRDTFVVPTRYEKLFNDRFASNLLETEASYIVQLVLPGVDVNTLQLNVVGQQLTIKALCHIPEIENATYLWHGLMAEEFNEVFTLPTEVLGDKAEAKYEYGILTVELPKTEFAKPKTIKVSTIK